MFPDPVMPSVISLKERLSQRAFSAFWAKPGAFAWLLLAMLIQASWIQPCAAEKYALVIGVSQYGEGSGISTLYAADTDAKMIAAALETVGFAKENITTLTSTGEIEMTSKSEGPFKSTRNNILSAFTKILRDIKDGDQIFIHFSGHGTTANNMNYMAGTDAKLDTSNNIDVETTLPVETFVKRVRALDQSGIEMVGAFDMCRTKSEGAKSGSENGPVLVKDLAKRVEQTNKPPEYVPPKIAFIYSSETTYPSYEGIIARSANEKPRGFFSRYLELGLLGQAEKKPGAGINTADLVEYLKKEVPPAVRQVQDNIRQIPWVDLSGDAASKIILKLPAPPDIQMVTDPPEAIVRVNDQLLPRKQSAYALDLTQLMINPEAIANVKIEANGYEIDEGTLKLSQVPDKPGQWTCEIRSKIGDYNGVVTIARGGSVTFPVWKLKKKPTEAKIRIQSELPFDGVLVNGKVREKQPDGLFIVRKKNDADKEGYIEVAPLKEGFIKQVFLVSWSDIEKQNYDYPLKVRNWEPRPQPDPSQGRVNVPQKTTLVVESEPVGARVLIDGQEQAGKLTPCEILYDLKEGETRQLRVEVIKDGFEMSEGARAITLKAGQSSTFIAPLSAIITEGMLQLASDPPGADIYLDGQKLEGQQTPYEIKVPLVEKSSREIQVRLEKVGYTPMETTFTVNRSPYALPFTMKLSPAPVAASEFKNHARLYIDSFPEGAKVVVNGEPVPDKLTPCEIMLPMKEGEEQRDAQIRLEKAGYVFEDNKEKKVSLWRGKTSFYVLPGRPTVQMEEVSGWADAKVLGNLASANRTIFVDVQKWKGVTIYDAAGRRLNTLPPAKTLYNVAALAPTNTPLIAIGVGNPIMPDKDAKVLLWNYKEQKPLPLKGHDKAVLALAFSRDGQMLASGGGDEDVLLWKLAPNATSASIVARIPVENPMGGWTTSLALSPDGKMLAIGYGDPSALSTPLNTMIKVWDISTPTRPQLRIALPAEHNQIHRASVSALSFSSDGQMLASGDTATNIALWDLKNGAILHKSELSKPGMFETSGVQLLGVRSLAFSPNSDLLACGSGDRRISVIQVEKGERVKLLEDQAWLDSVGFTPDGALWSVGKANTGVHTVASAE